MANRRITKDDIYRVASELTARGIGPSSKLVREELGSGSLSTISKYLKMWREECELEAKEPVEINLQELFDGVDSDVIAELFHNEHPHVVALCMSYLGPSQAATIIKRLSVQLREEVLIRMESMGFVQTKIAQEIFRVVKDEIEFIKSNQCDQPGGVELVQQIRSEMGATK